MIFISYYILIFVFSAHGLPTKQGIQSVKEDVNCLIMSPEIQDQINDITNKIATFITDVSKKYDNIDLRLININIDKHSAVETNKTTVLRVNINDCLTKHRYRKYETNNVKNDNYKTKDDRKEINTNVKSIQEDSIDFDDLDNEEDLKSQVPISDDYLFVGDTRFVSADEDDQYVMNYEKMRNNSNVTDENNNVQLIYYFNFSDNKNKNVSCKKVFE